MTFRKTHDLNELGGQCAALNPSRYLDAPREPDESEAMAALETAGCVFEEVNALLAPPSAV